MLKVECESCKAPYQIDERRVPASGLKMRCPRCGHSFVVTATAVDRSRLPEPSVALPSLRIAQPTMVGVAPPAPIAAPQSPPWSGQSAQAPPRMVTPLPSDFPAALGSLDESDLPVVAPGLPTHKPATPMAPAPNTAVVNRAVPGAHELTLDLPVLADDLPAARRETPGAARPSASFDLDLPAALSDLPQVQGSDLPQTKHAAAFPAERREAPKSADLLDLPSVQSDLPAASAGLPSVQSDLPAASAGLPAVSASHPSFTLESPAPPASLRPLTRTFGDLDLPSELNAPSRVPTADPSPALGSLPPPAARAQDAEAIADRTGDGRAEDAGAFGELDLPREAPVVAPVIVQPAGRSADPTDFGDLQLDEKPRTSKVSVRAAPARPETAHAGGGMSFGEVQFGEADPVQEGKPQAVEVAPQQAAVAVAAIESAIPSSVVPQAAASARVERPRPAAPPRKRSIRRQLTGALVVLALLGGAALQLTPAGAYGYLALNDIVHAKDYERAMAATMAETERALALDTYDAARGAVDSAAAAQSRMRRAKPLAAYAALVDFAMAVRFGPDMTRASRGSQLLAALPRDEPVKYRDVALAAQAAENDDLDKARKTLEEASRRNAGDPIQLEIAYLRGDIELASRDGAAALAAFDRAAASSNDARAHFGLARSHDLLDDLIKASNEIEATLALSPSHPGALTLRAAARMKSSPADDGQALKDLAAVLEGPARAKASPNELSTAYALKARISLDRGSSSEARDAFGEAVKLNPRNLDALNGEGRLFLNEGRFTEALTRFETALQLDAASAETIANDAEAKIALERFAEAKQQLVGARQRFPKNMAVLSLLGKVEEHLGNKNAASTILRSAIALVDPSRRDAVLPYVAMSQLLSSQGQWSEARAVLDDARSKLPSSAALDRAFGDLAALQGDYEKAIANYRSAIARDPHDAGAHFRLGSTLCKMRRFDEASAEFDHVAAVDRDYPGLSLARGLLFEESGDVEKAIDQFKSALARAPEDPDLQLRVGSAYVAIGQPESAIPMLRKVLDKRPTSAEAHHYLGRALMLQGPSLEVEALRNLRRAVDLDGNRAEYHVYVAWAANEATPAQLELARDEVDRALALDSLNAEAYWQKGVLERMEGAIEDAIRDEKRALELRPSRYEAHATMAECYQDRNDDAASISEWAKAISNDAATPQGEVRHPYWRYKYGKLLAEHGNFAAALPLLLGAANTVEKGALRAGWIAPLEFLTAEALRKSGRKVEAIDHYKRFLEIAPATSPDRTDAQNALAQLTAKR
ncbi:MAG: zinc-ribbon domain-containing protein [Myxococcota bacterium]|nr:zinc-ribbon domain-containing protein [Myxococcota bacterium]